MIPPWVQRAGFAQELGPFSVLDNATNVQVIYNFEPYICREAACPRLTPREQIFSEKTPCMVFGNLPVIYTYSVGKIERCITKMSGDSIFTP